MTYPGAPSIYYGDEVGMLGRTDPDCRRTFNWNRETWDMEILDFTKKCIRIRKEHAAVRTGKFQTLYAHDDVMVYVCTLEDDQVLIAFNRSNQSRLLDVDVTSVFPGNIDLKGELNIQTIKITDGKINELSLPPFSGLIASRN